MPNKVTSLAVFEQCLTKTDIYFLEYQSNELFPVKPDDICRRSVMEVLQAIVDGVLYYDYYEKEEVISNSRGNSENRGLNLLK